jgi:hypothetical protein
MKSATNAGFYIRIWYKPEKTRSSKDWFIPRIMSRIGVKSSVNETASRKRGSETLTEALKDGKPVITYLTIGRIKEDKFIHYLP